MMVSVLFQAPKYKQTPQQLWTTNIFISFPFSRTSVQLVYFEGMA